MEVYKTFIRRKDQSKYFIPMQFSAFGGAWKDAPVEGFETFKFFRSPGVAYFYALVASLFTSNLLLITMGSIGFTIMSIETYKTFFFLDRPRGKLQGMPVTHPEWETKRKKFVPLYAGIWSAVLVIGVMGWMAPHVSLWS